MRYEKIKLTNYYLCVGPAHGANTGQKVCFLESIRALGLHEVEVYSVGGHNISSIDKLTILVCSYIKYTFSIVKSKDKVFYITPSRSVTGFLRELYFLLPGLLFARKKVAHWHGADVNLFLEKTNFLVRGLYVWVYSRFDTHIVLTESMVEQVKLFKPEEISVIGNFHDIKASPRKFKEFYNNKKLELIFLSNLIPSKGVEFALRLGDELDQYVNLSVIGSLPEDSKQRKQIVEFLNNCNSRYLGYLEGDEKLEVLRGGDVFIFPSTYPTEAFPLVLLEAMASGLAIIAFDHNYISDFFNKDGGALIRVNDFDQAAEYVEKLYVDRGYLNSCKASNVKCALKYTSAEYREKIRTTLGMGVI